MLEYHLGTITNRSQEAAFATFARRLVEREICPNLLPQTGPTGGGDSKVDSETYPVADEVTLGWFCDEPRGASTERWGFAFSAKEKWRAKVADDVAKAVGTGRGYGRIYFVSSQFVRDKDRAEVEDKLGRDHGLDVRILDRSWIIERVFKNRHEDLAISELGLCLTPRKVVQQGPRDLQREKDLAEAEARIKASLASQAPGVSLVDDCLETAYLVRALERPRTEVDGHHDRAERAAQKHGTRQQQFTSAYQRAWTALWWYEDYAQLNTLYDLVAQRALGSDNAYDLERWVNVWCLLQGAVLNGKLGKEEACLEVRTACLLEELTHLAGGEGRPSTALECRAMKIQVQLSLAAAAGEPTDTLLTDLADVVSRSEGLAGFPFESICDCIIELGNTFGDVSAYDLLFQKTVAIQSSRKGEVSAARLLQRRGEQLLFQGHPYDAIRTLGQCLRRLYKHETREEAVSALYLCGCAYEQVGFLWAARGTILAGATLAGNDFLKYGEVTMGQAVCSQRIKLIELQLGRVPHALSWHDVDRMTRSGLVQKGGDPERLFCNDQAFDIVLGMLLLRTSAWELKRLTFLPEVLDRLSLPGASISVLYALGHEDELRETLQTTSDDLREFFRKLRAQTAAKDLPPSPLFYEERRVVLQSRILGCEISIESENSPRCVQLSESVLAALESMLATGTFDTMICREPSLTMTVRTKDPVSSPFEFELSDETGRPHLKVECMPFEPTDMPIDLRHQMSDRLFELLTMIFARIVLAKDLNALLDRLFRDELVLDRSLNFTGSFIGIGNIFGAHPKFSMSDWTIPEGRVYPVFRSEVWDCDEAPPPPNTEGSSKPDAALIRQDEIRSVSLIRESLWNKAKWFATAYAYFGDQAPALAIVFRDREAGVKIFRYWREELGVEDAEEQLRVAIIRGVDRKSPFSYSVHIGSDLNNVKHQGARFVASMSRVNRMDPTSHANLTAFTTDYQAFGGYALVPAVWDQSQTQPEFLWDAPYIVKRGIYIRDAWEIGLNDPDSTVLQDTDEPVVPDDRQHYPALEVIQREKSRKKA